ncbi:MAG: phosphate signaling complex protein PhoU [Pseudomonadota bacterium]|nr:phosphate signaling complex protein PhoU [Pseudomonadota bacterium]
MSQTEHISKQFDADLERLRASVLQMGGLVEQQIEQALHALTTGDIRLADQVVEKDHHVNAMEVALDEDCNHIIARRQPAAGDLRMVMTVVKLITDLERIGDEADKIARMAKLIHTSERLYTPRLADIKHIANLALEMLRKALDAFARLDTTTAVALLRQDELVDEAYRAILRQLLTFMMEDPRTISASLEILFIAKAIERIGDHSKNMAEYIIYLVKGKDVRHVSVDQVE